MVEIASVGRFSDASQADSPFSPGPQQSALVAVLEETGREADGSARALARLRRTLSGTAEELRRNVAPGMTERLSPVSALPMDGLSNVQAGSDPIDNGLFEGAGTSRVRLDALAVGPSSRVGAATHAASTTIEFNRLGAEGVAAFGALESASDSASRRIVRGFGAALDAGTSFREAVRDVAIELSELGVRTFVLNPIEQGVGQGFSLLFESFGKALGAVPARAAGGPVTARQPFLVGEQGPELFVPREHGTIIPSAGAVTQHITVNVDGGINSQGRKTPGQVAALISRELVRANRRNN